MTLAEDMVEALEETSRQFREGRCFLSDPLQDHWENEGGGLGPDEETNPCAGSMVIIDDVPDIQLSSADKTRLMEVVDNYLSDGRMVVIQYAGVGGSLSVMRGRRL